MLIGSKTRRNTGLSAFLDEQKRKGLKKDNACAKIHVAAELFPEFAFAGVQRRKDERGEERFRYGLLP